MAAILATIDVEDLATPKTTAARDALTSLVRDLNDMQAAAAGATASLGASTQTTTAATAGFKAVQQAVAATTQPLQGLKSGIVDYLTLLQQAVQQQVQSEQSLKLYAGGLAALTRTMQAGNAVIYEEIGALRELAEAAKAGNGFTAEQAKVLAALHAQVAAGIPLTQQQINQLHQLTEEYAAAHGEALGLGTAVQQLITREQEHTRVVLETVKALQVLHAQMKVGSTVTATQAAAMQELSARAQQGNGFTTVQAAAIQKLSGAMTAGTTVTKQHSAALAQLGQGYAAANNGSAAAATGLQKFHASAMVLIAALAVLAAGVTAYLKAATLLAARVETLGVVQVVVARNANLSVGVLHEQVEALKKLGITTVEATEAVMQFVQADLRLADAGKLATAAQNLAVVAGLNSSQAYDRLLRAINTQEPMLLRQFGIMANMDQVMAKYAQSINKAVTELGPLDRKQAILNLVLTEGEKATGAYAASMNTAGKQLGSMARLTEELQLKMGNVLLPIFGPLIKLVFEFLTALEKAGPTSMAVAAAIGLVTAALLGFKLLMITGILPALKAFSVAMLTTPFGLWILAITALVAIYLRWNAATTVNVEQLEKESAAVQTNITKMEDLRTKITALEAVVKKSADQTKELEAAYASLRQVAPEAVEYIDGKWRIHVGVLGEVIEKEREYQTLKMEQSRDEVQRMQKVEADLIAQEQALSKRLAQIRTQGAQAQPGISDDSFILGTALDTMESIKKKMLEVGTTRREVTAELEKLVPNYEAQAERLDPVIARTKQLERTVREAAAAGVKFNDVRLEGALQKIGLSLALLKDPLANLEQLKALFEGIAKATAALEIEDTKAAAAKVKYAAAFKSAYEAITGTSDSLAASLSASNKAFGEVAVGSAEYISRLERGGSAIAQYNKLTEDQQRKYTALGIAAKQLEAIQLDKLFRGWAAEATATAKAFDEFTASSLNALRAQGVTEDRQIANSITSGRIDAIAKRDQLERESFDLRTRKYKTELQLALSVEAEKIAAIERNTARERQIRAAAFEEERMQLEEKFRLIKLEGDRRVTAIREEMQQKQMAVELDIAGQVATGALNADVAARRLENFRGVAQMTNEWADAQKRAYDVALAEEEEWGIARIDRRQRAQTELDAIEDAGNAHVVAGIHYTMGEIRKSFDGVRQFKEKMLLGIVDTMATAFGNILTKTQSWKEAMLGIFNDLKTSFARIVTDMVKTWLVNGVKAMMGDGTTGGSGMSGMIGSLKKGIGDLKGALSQLMGGAGPTMQANATPAGLLPSSSLSQQGVSGLMGAPRGVSSGAGGAAGVGMGAKVMGGAGVALSSGMVGYQVGGYFNSKTKGTLAGAGAGAATGAVMGSVVPGIGTAVGAGIGAIAGAIGGWIAAGKERREVEKLRKEFVAAKGGAVALQAAAKEAGVSIDAIFDKNTDNMAEWTAAIVKLEAATQAGGMDQLRQKAEAVGVNIDRIFRIKDAERFNAEMAKLAGLFAEQEKRLQGLKTAADGLTMRTAGYLTGLEKDLTTIWDGLSKKTQSSLEKGFAAAVKKGFSGNEMEWFLQQLKKVSEGGTNKYKLPTSALNEYREMVARTEEDFQRLGHYATMTFAAIIMETGDLVSAMEAIGPTLDAIEKSKKDFGFETNEAVDKLLLLRKTVTDNADIMTSISGIQSLLKGMKEAKILSQSMFTELGKDLSNQHGRLISRGVDADTAMLSVLPALQQLYEAQKSTGFTLDPATQALLDDAKRQGLVGDKFMGVQEKILATLVIIAENLTGERLPDALGGSREANEGNAADREAEAKWRNQVDYAKLTGQVAAMIALMRQGVEKGWLDPATGTPTRTDPRHGTTGPGRIGGGDPNAAPWPLPVTTQDIQTLNTQTAEAANTMNQLADNVDRVSFGSSPGGLKEIPLKIADAIVAFRAFRDTVATDSTAVDSNVDDMTQRFKAMKPGADGEIIPGQSIWDLIRERQAKYDPNDPNLFRPDVEPRIPGVDYRAHEGDPNVIGPNGEPVVPVEGEGTPLIRMGDITIDVTALDGEDMERVFAAKIAPALKAAMESNAAQLATQMEGYLARYRR